MSANVERWRAMAEAELARQDSPVPLGLVLAIIEAESTGNPRAYRGEAALHDGSIGLMQILSATARGLGYTGINGDPQNQNGLFDPATNIRYGVMFLTDLWQRLGSASDVASAYNGGVRPSIGFGGVVAGPNPVTVCLARDGQGSCIRRFTAQPGQYGNQGYVDKVLAAWQRYTPAHELPPVIITSEGGGSGGGASAVVVAGLVVLGALAVKKFV